MAKRRDVIIAEVFFSDSVESKLRPCIVLSDDAYAKGGYAIVAMITGAADEYGLPISNADASCRLYDGSRARFDCMMRIDEGQVSRRIGRVTGGFYRLLVSRMIGLIKENENG